MENKDLNKKRRIRINSVQLPQFDRAETLEFNWVPKSEEEFYSIINNAPYDILIGFGFRKCEIVENYFGNINDIKKFANGEEIWLFPSEWYEVIPEGFPSIDIFGVETPFKNGIASKDTRFGCLGYGIKR